MTLEKISETAYGNSNLYEINDFTYYANKYYLLIFHISKYEGEGISSITGKSLHILSTSLDDIFYI